MNSWLVALLGPFALSVAMIAVLLRTPWAARLSDHPNERSLHTQPTPRLGGVAIVLSAIPIAMTLTAPSLGLAWALALGLALVSFADDLRSLPIAIRLPVHFAAAAIAVAALASEGAAWPVGVLVFATVAIAWTTNLYNFMDGADGLAGGMAVIGFGAYALAAAHAGSTTLALASASLVSAALGFLCFNFPPARVFMGDTGSIPLGFLAGVLGLAGIANGAWPAWFPFLVFSPFIVDASVTLVRRVVRQERFWIAHRSHYYQRLVLAGWSKRRLALCAYAVMACAAASAVGARGSEEPIQYAILGLWSLAYVVVIVAIERSNILQGASS